MFDNPRYLSPIFNNILLVSGFQMVHQLQQIEIIFFLLNESISVHVLMLSIMQLLPEINALLIVDRLHMKANDLLQFIGNHSHNISFNNEFAFFLFLQLNNSTE